MSATPAPPAVVEAATPVPQTTGLIASAAVNPDPPGTRWQGGFRLRPRNCRAGTALQLCDNTTTKTIPSNQPIVDNIPVVLWAGDKCSPFDMTHDYPAWARQLLQADASRQLAYEFWTGTQAKTMSLPTWAAHPNQYLADNSTVDVISLTPLNPGDALACLEDALGSCTGERGMIHCTPGTLEKWQAIRAVEKVGQLHVTANETIIVADKGYPGTGPHGQAGALGNIWAYATTLVTVRLDEIQVFPDPDNRSGAALERTQNTFEYRAEQLAAVTHSGCCHKAVPIDMIVCSHTGGS